MPPFVDLSSVSLHREGVLHASMKLSRGDGVFVRVGDNDNEEGAFDKGIVDRVRVVLEPRTSIFVLVVWCWEPSGFLPGVRAARERRGVSVLEQRAGLYLGTGRQSCQFVHVDSVGALAWKAEPWQSFSQFCASTPPAVASERRQFGLARAVVWQGRQLAVDPPLDSPPLADLKAHFEPLDVLAGDGRAALLAAGLELAESTWHIPASVVGASSDVGSSCFAAAVPCACGSTAQIERRSRRSVFLGNAADVGACRGYKRCRQAASSVEGDTGDSEASDEVVPAAGTTFDTADEALNAVARTGSVQLPRTATGTALWFSRRLARGNDGYYPRVWGSAQLGCIGACVPVALRDAQAMMQHAVDDELRCRNRGAGGDAHFARPRINVRIPMLRSVAAVLLHNATLARVKHGDEDCATFELTPLAVQDMFGAVAVHVPRTEGGLMRQVEGGPPFQVRGASLHLRWCFTTEGDLGRAVFHCAQQVLQLKKFPVLYVKE